MPAVAAPVEGGERNLALDVLRGFALLGILLMNVVGFGLHRSAYDVPNLSGGAGGPNTVAWVVMHLLAEGKMRCLFSLVFGAGVVLLTSRLEARAPEAAGDVYYRRMLWLLAFGVAHAYLLWWGDILYPYALCGLVLYPLRRLRARTLALLAAAVLAATTASYAHYAWQREDIFTRAQQAQALSDTGGRSRPSRTGLSAGCRAGSSGTGPGRRSWRGTPRAGAARSGTCSRRAPTSCGGATRRPSTIRATETCGA